MQSEIVVYSGTPTADTWTDVGTFTVPAGVQSLKMLSIGVSVDPGGAITARFAPVVRLIGSGLLEQSPHQFNGPAGNNSAAASGGIQIELNNADYEVDIPVSVGGTYLAQVNFVGEGAVPVTVKIQAVYSKDAASGRNSMADYVSAAQPTAADSWQTVGTLTVPQLAQGKSPVSIREVSCVHATDQAALALLRSSSHFRLTGSGVAEGGTHEFMGPSGGASGATTGAYGYSKQNVRQKIDVPVNAGGTILVEAKVDSELPTAGTVIFGVLYA